MGIGTRNRSPTMRGLPQNNRGIARMKNKQKQAHVARKINNGGKRVKLQIYRKHELEYNAFVNMWKCKDGACRKLNK